MKIIKCVVAAGGVMALAGACSGSSPKSGASTPPPLGPIPTVTSVDQLVRPIDAYLPTEQQVGTLMKAQNVALAQCVRGFGLQPNASSGSGSDDGALYGRRSRDKLYGVFNPSNVSRFGYDFSGASNPRRAGGPASTPSEPLREVMSGRDQSGQTVATFDGKPVPKGGCAVVALGVVGGQPPSIYPDQLPGQGPRVPPSDPRLVAAIAKWSACMKGRGFAYQTPVDAANAVMPDPRKDPPAANPLEIPTAEADMACKQSTNLMGTVLALETAYDKQYIDSHATALTDFAKQLNDRVRKAAQIIADGGVGSTGTPSS